MTDDRLRRTTASALDRLAAALEAPRVLALSPEDESRLAIAIERVRAQLLGPSQPVLTVALAGGTGVGKSTLINALAGHVIAEASEIRPTTRHIQVYHHREDTLGNLPKELASDAAFVAHDRPELRLKMIVDAPDLDSFVVRHRATTKALLRRSGLVLYVFSPERYLEERTWSVLRQETEFSACAAVLNKSDKVGGPDELEQITEDLRAQFAGLGVGDVRIFRVCARAHVPDASGNLPAVPAVVDDMVALRAYIERELHASEIARLLRAQRVQVIEHLRGEVDRIAPADATAKLDQIDVLARSRAAESAARLAGTIAGQLAAVEAELSPLVTLRRHERFWGPFRVWLAASDFVTFGLTSVIRRSVRRQSNDRTTAIERILAQAGTLPVEALLRSESYALQDRLFAAGLPIERWRQIAAGVDGARLVAEVTREIEVDFDVIAARSSDRGHTVVWAVSTLGSLVPAALVLIGLVVMTRDMFVGNYAGFPLLGHLLGMVLLFFLALQGLVGVLLPDGRRLGTSVGPQAIHRVVERTLGQWLETYRGELSADLAGFREPLLVLESALESRDDGEGEGAGASVSAGELREPVSTAGGGRRSPT
jgi:hypothetical protein